MNFRNNLINFLNLKMTDVTDGAEADTSAQETTQSDFKKYLEQNPEGPEELMKILVSLYNNPTKQS